MQLLHAGELGHQLEVGELSGAHLGELVEQLAGEKGGGGMTHREVKVINGSSDYSNIIILFMKSEYDKPEITKITHIHKTILINTHAIWTTKFFLLTTILSECGDMLSSSIEH